MPIISIITLVYTPFAFLVTRMVFGYIESAESEHGLSFFSITSSFLVISHLKFS